jgi:CobQ-like glutamine amidotransferase family enzyme
VRAGDPLPAGCELSVVGGGEDLPQAQAALQLGPGLAGPLGRAVNDGAAVLAVCAGLQILGVSFVGPDGVETAGVGLLDCCTRRGQGPRAVGEIVVEPAAELGLPTLSGYENHAGVTSVGPGATPVGRVIDGVGNGDGSGADGVRSGRVLGTYLHGPVLARNPALADHLLTSVVGDLTPLDDRDQLDLHDERLTAATAGRVGRWRRAAWHRRLPSGRP